MLGRLDKGELQELMENEAQLNEMIENMDARKQIQTIRETLLASNRSLAEYNLGLEPKLHSGREKLIEAHQNQQQLQEAFDQNRKKLEEASSDYAPDTTLALLQTATAQAEEEAEKTVDKFLEKEIASDEFIQKFLEQKTLHHLRRTKTEKLTELLRSRMSSQYSYRF